MSDLPDFTIAVDQNKHLPEGGHLMHAVLTVAATGAPQASAARDTQAAEVIIVDTSGSMAGGGKMAAAKRAAAVAVDGLRDGVWFAIVSGSHTAQMVYPRSQGLVPATEDTRREAKAAIGRLAPDGGTAIGTWLRLTDDLFSPYRGALCHAILLTDGKNQHERPEQLDAAVRGCLGHFMCHCRGVGTDWVVDELRTISSALLGDVGMAADPGELEADFQAMTEGAMGKAVADVSLRIWIPQSASVRFVKQVHPEVQDLTARRTDGGPQAGDYPTGSWGDEQREYHICVEVTPGDVGRELRAAWVKVVAADADQQIQTLASGNVLAAWTDDESQSTQINHRVAQYTGQEELAEAIQEGLRARTEGDTDTATARLGRAVALAEQTGNEDTGRLLRKVVDVEDPATGTVRLKKDVAKADEMFLDTRSTRTVRTGRRPDDAAGTQG